MSKELNDQLTAFLEQEMKSGQKPKIFEEIFQKTLDLTTPTQPGDLRNHRKWDEKPKDELDEWL